MSATDQSSSHHHHRQQAAAADDFAVDFDGVRASFGGSDSDGGKGGAAGGVLNARSLAGAGAAALAPLVLGVAEASAKGGEFGIIEGKTASFFHPIVMVRRNLCTVGWGGARVLPDDTVGTTAPTYFVFCEMPYGRLILEELVQYTGWVCVENTPEAISPRGRGGNGA